MLLTFELELVNIVRSNGNTNYANTLLLNIIITKLFTSIHDVPFKIIFVTLKFLCMYKICK